MIEELWRCPYCKEVPYRAGGDYQYWKDYGWEMEYSGGKHKTFEYFGYIVDY